MDSAFSIACILLQTIATGMATLNEVMLIATPWIIATSPSRETTIPFPSPVWTSLAYACVEPLYAELIAKTGFPPWIYLPSAAHHLLACQWTKEYLKYLGRSQNAVKPPQIDTSTFKDRDDDLELQPTAHERQTPWRPEWQAFIATMYPLNSAAASNAALLVFAANLKDLLIGENPGITLGLSYFGMVLYFGSRFEDLNMTWLTKKIPLWRRQPLQDLKLQLGHLALLVLVKISVRKILHHDPFPVLQIMGSRGMHPSLAKEMPSWLAACIAWEPPWPRWMPGLLSLVLVPVQIYAFRLFLRSLDA